VAVSRGIAVPFLLASLLTTNVCFVALYVPLAPCVCVCVVNQAARDLVKGQRPVRGPQGMVGKLTSVSVSVSLSVSLSFSLCVSVSVCLCLSLSLSLPLSSSPFLPFSISRFLVFSLPS
jgi:hypothetical protein